MEIVDNRLNLTFGDLKPGDIFEFPDVDPKYKYCYIKIPTTIYNTGNAFSLHGSCVYSVAPDRQVNKVNAKVIIDD